MKINQEKLEKVLDELADRLDLGHLILATDMIDFFEAICEQMDYLKDEVIRRDAYEVALSEIVASVDLANSTGLHPGRSPKVWDAIDKARELVNYLRLKS